MPNAIHTRFYFGDGVYGEFDGIRIILTANGIGDKATDRIFLEPRMLDDMLLWKSTGYCDWNSGQPFGPSVLGGNTG